jgi:hypothetical protein
VSELIAVPRRTYVVRDARSPGRRAVRASALQFTLLAVAEAFGARRLPAG